MEDKMSLKFSGMLPKLSDRNLSVGYQDSLNIYNTIKKEAKG